MFTRLPSRIIGLFKINTLLFVTVCAALAVIGMAYAGAGSAPPADGKWVNHPALQSFALAGKDLPAELYLVRTRGELPDDTGLTVHGTRNGVYVVSGEREVVMGLAYKGCAVFPLGDRPAVSRSPHREWTPLDAPDPDIAAMVDQVEWSGVSAKIQWLVDFGTRYSFADNHEEVADSIAAVFAGYGLTPVKRSFVHQNYTMWNVEATQTGTVYPDSFYIICGHFDSISNQARLNAPGADDNGTGVATVFTAAEILTQYDFEYSIRYICFAAEEQGLIGSQHYAAWATSVNLGIVGVLNFDMMGYWEPGVEMDLEIETNHASQWLSAAIVNAADLYTSTPYQLHVYDGAWWGDHASFWDQGYAAVNHEEAWDWGDPDFNPYYHTTEDLLTYVGSVFTVGNTKVGVAALATLVGYDPGIGVVDPATPPAFSGTFDAFPNPFSGRVNFSVTGLSGRDRVRVLIYDARGRRVAAVSLTLSDGRGSASWDHKLGAGVYFGKLEGIPGVTPVKIVHVK